MEIWGTGEVTRDFIHVSYVVDALIESVFYCGPHRRMNVGSGVGLSINRVVQDLEQVLDQGKLVVTRKPGRDADVPVNVLDISLITQETAWRPLTRWVDGLRDTIAWMRSHESGFHLS